MNMHLRSSWPDPYKDWSGLCIVKVEHFSFRGPIVYISEKKIGMRIYSKVTKASMLRLRAVLAAFDPPGIVLDDGSTIFREWHLPAKRGCRWSPGGEPGVWQMRPPIRIPPDITWPGGEDYAEMARRHFSSR